MRSALVLTANCSTLNNSSLERKMLPTTMLVVTTLSERKLLTWFWTGFVNWLINVLDFKDFWSSTHSEVALDPDSHPSWWNVSLLIMERSPSWSLPSTQLLKCLPLSLNHTIPFWPPTPLWSTLTAPSWSIMRQYMTSADVIWTLSDQPTPTWTVSLAKLFPQLLHPFDSMVPLMWILPSSRPTWCHTHVFISHWSPTHLSSVLKRHTMSSSPLPKLQTPVSSLPTRWWNAIHDMASTWHVACCTVVMSSPRTSTPPLLPSRPRGKLICPQQ